jgi:hypothetical protein
MNRGSGRPEPIEDNGGNIMWHARAVTCALGVAIIAAFALSAERSYAQGYGPNDAPNPYKFEYGWAKLPDGRKWGAAVSVAIDRDG